MNTYDPDTLLEFSANLIEAMGSPCEDALIVARHLVEAQLAGHDSNGVIRLPQYHSHVREGKVKPGARVEIVRESPTTALLDGHYTWGQVTAMKAIELGIAKAEENGIAALSLRNCYHVGRVGVYPLAAAERGLIAQVHCNGHGVCRVAPWGGTEPRLATNPVAVAIPTRAEPLLVDITTSVVAEGKVRIVRNRGGQLPLGWIIDAEGHPSTEPGDFYDRPRGSLLPFGGSLGHKGYGLGVVVDLLSGALSGAGCTRGRNLRIGNGCFLLVVDIGRFQPLEEYSAQIKSYIAYLKASPKAAGFADILMPGELEQRERQKRREGIFVEDETWGQILVCGRRIGAIIPEPGA